MALNIKNQRVCDLAREAAALTGGSQVSVLEEALLMFIQAQEVSREAKRQRVDIVLAEIDAALTDPDRAAIRRRLGEFYDEDGLPV